MEETKERISELEDSILEMTQSEQQRKGNRLEKETEQSLRDLWDCNKRPYICVNRFPEGEENEEVGGKVFKVTMVENFPNLPKDVSVHILKAEGTQNRINPNKPI